jgi:hypothetical protein
MAALHAHIKADGYSAAECNPSVWRIAPETFKSLLCQHSPLLIAQIHTTGSAASEQLPYAYTSCHSVEPKFIARFRAWLAVTHAIEFFCMSVAKLMVLERMSDFVSLGAGGSSKRWAVGRKMVMDAVVAGNLVGLAGNVTAASQR